MVLDIGRQKAKAATLGGSALWPRSYRRVLVGWAPAQPAINKNRVAVVADVGLTWLCRIIFARPIQRRSLLPLPFAPVLLLPP